MKTLIIIPAYNEEKCIKKVVDNVMEVNNNVDVLVVNDGSKDDTLIEAKKTKAKDLNLPFNLGLGGAVQAGYLYAYKNNYDVAIQLDGDGQHNPKYIEEMVNIIKENKAEMVIGSRFIEETGYNQTFAELGTDIKNSISHRAQAIKKLIEDGIVYEQRDGVVYDSEGKIIAKDESRIS